MWWWKRNREAKDDLREARRRRQAAEEQYLHEQRTIVRPLREMRARNHITEELVRIIREGGGG